MHPREAALKLEVACATSPWGKFSRKAMFSSTWLKVSGSVVH
jgi:hypothetical protein